MKYLGYREISIHSDCLKENQVHWKKNTAEAVEIQRKTIIYDNLLRVRYAFYDVLFDE